MYSGCRHNQQREHSNTQAEPSGTTSIQGTSPIFLQICLDFLSHFVSCLRHNVCVMLCILWVNKIHDTHHSSMSYFGFTLFVNFESFMDSLWLIVYHSCRVTFFSLDSLFFLFCIRNSLFSRFRGSRLTQFTRTRITRVWECIRKLNHGDKSGHHSFRRSGTKTWSKTVNTFYFDQNVK